MKLYLDGSRGQYLPRDFARDTKRSVISGVDAAVLDYLARGPGGCLDEELPLTADETVRGEFYWDIWQTVLDDAVLTDPKDGARYTLYQNDDLWLVPEGWERDDSSESFRPPESDTLRRFTLPAPWASYLINGDASGLEDGEETQIKDFLTKEGLTDWSCANCQPAGFSWNPDAGMAGSCEEFTFIKF